MKPIKQLHLWTASLGTVLLLACGGGGGTQTAGDIGTTGTGFTPDTISTGPITGFGSIIVNGIRYDDKTPGQAAVISIEDQDDDNGGLKLGMVSRVDAKLNDDKVSGQAAKIEMSAEVRGPVESVFDTAANTFQVMGVKVLINPSTILDNLTEPTALAIGDSVQVHGLPDSAGTVIATRLQKRVGAPTVFKTAGLVATSSATELVLVGGLKVTLNAQTSVRDLASPIPVNTFVRVKTTAAPVAGIITATQVRPLFLPAPATPQYVNGQIEGAISGLNGNNLSVAGLPVVVNSSTQYLPTGTTQASLVNGLIAEVEGSASNGVITATKVKLKKASDGGVEYKFLGPVTTYVSAADFTIKGQRIDASGATVDFRNGTAADLNNPAKNQNVEVRGTTFTNGLLIATRVEFR